MKHTIPFRGVKTADIRAALRTWLHHTAPDASQPETPHLELALRLIEQPFAEDKLAGILLIQEVLLPAGALDWRRDLPRFAALFQNGYIYEWNTCDWFCVRVLGPIAEREGEACARAIAAWRSADTVWQRRAAGVAFVNLAANGDRNFRGFVDMLLEVCSTTVQSSERFAQTGTGWVLRELSHAAPERVSEFIATHIRHFSREGLRYATAKLPSETKARLSQMHREQKQ